MELRTKTVACLAALTVAVTLTGSLKAGSLEDASGSRLRAGVGLAQGSVNAFAEKKAERVAAQKAEKKAYRFNTEREAWDWLQARIRAGGKIIKRTVEAGGEVVLTVVEATGDIIRIILPPGVENRGRYGVDHCSPYDETMKPAEHYGEEGPHCVSRNPATVTCKKYKLVPTLDGEMGWVDRVVCEEMDPPQGWAGSGPTDGGIQAP